MDEQAIAKYLSEDFAKAIRFYDDGAVSSKRMYRFLSIYVIVISALLTLLIAFAPSEICWRIFTAALSVTIVIATGLLAHLKCHENWLSYRASWDALQREKRLYETGTDAYAKAEDKNSLFVSRVETVLAKEGAEFYARHARGEDQEKKTRKKAGA